MLVEIIVENYEPQYLWEMTNASQFCPLTDQEKQIAQALKANPQLLAQMGGKPPLPQAFTQALALLKSQKMRDFRINVETDSTIALDGVLPSRDPRQQ